MTNVEKFTEYVLTNFQSNKGRCSLYCSDSKAYLNLVCETIRMFHNKRPQSQILVVVDDYTRRIEIRDAVWAKGYTVINKYDIKILTKDYIKSGNVYANKLVITVGVHDYNTISIFTRLPNRFVLSILTQTVTNHAEINSIRKDLIDVNVTKFNNSIGEDYVYSPVEEHRVSVSLDVESTKKYKHYTDYINNAISMFGSMDILEKCRIGDTKNNISASEFRYNLAVANGWSSGLDIHIDFQRKIDELYNPNSLTEYANNFYNFTRSRRDLVSSYYGKLPAIVDIVNANSDKKILIVSLKGEFAADVTEYINNHTNCKCGDYHDCLDNVYAVDEYGNPIYVKSGANKGEIKILGAQAQSTLNEKRFNSNLINVLSIKNASNTKLKIACDIVIFTSPLCADITELKMRFKNLVCNGIPNIIYVLYCDDTNEIQKLDKVTTKRVQRKIINDNEKDVEYDEISGSIIL